MASLPTGGLPPAPTIERRRELRRETGPVVAAIGARFFEPIPFPADGAEQLGKLSAEGEVVHIMRSASLLSFLYLAWALVRHGLTALRAVTGLNHSLWGPFRRLFQEGSAARQLTSALDARGSALVFLRERSGVVPRLEPSEDPFYALIARARASSRPLYLVPELFLLRNRARNLQPGFRDVLFGSPEEPGMLLTAWAFVRNYRNAFMRIGRPIDLTAFVRENPADTDEILVRRVRGSLLKHLAHETRAIVGPPRKPHARFIEQILRDRTLRETLDQVAVDQQREPQAVREEARRDLEEIASRYNPLSVACARPVLTWLFTRLHAGVDIDERGLGRALEVGRETPLVFCPSHKSHLDYLLMAWVFAERGIMPPLVAAGANLSFWPLGPFFRSAGAFFLRRSFKGDRVYTAAFRAYIKRLLREGYCQEFFIEGGRSRTGKLLSPKLGMVSFEVDAFLEGAQDDVYFVPVAIDYETVLEAKSYARELAGGEKKPESLRGLLATPKVLAGHYGHIHLNFDEPISLREFLRTRIPDFDSIAPDQRRAATRALAQRITLGISRASTLTPVALLAAALLAHRERSISARDAGARIHYLRGLAQRQGARLSKVLEGAPSDPSCLGPINDLVRLLIEDGLVEAQVDSEQTHYRVPDERRPALSFYKNNLVHLTVGRSMTAAALLAHDGEASREALAEDVGFLARLFKLEFSYRVDASLEEQVDEALSQLCADGLVELDDGRVRIASLPHVRGELCFLRDLIRDLLESYQVVAGALTAIHPGHERKEFIKSTLERGRAAYLSGTLAFTESVSRPSFENAVALFVDNGLLELSENGRTLTLMPDGAERSAAIAARLDSFLRD